MSSLGAAAASVEELAAASAAGAESDSVVEEETSVPSVVDAGASVAVAAVEEPSAEAVEAAVVSDVAAAGC